MPYELVLTGKFKKSLKLVSTMRTTLGLLVHGGRAMKHANVDACLNPCPPFFRGEEVSADAIDSGYFVGYEFKKHLLEVQQAVICYLLNCE